MTRIAEKFNLSNRPTFWALRQFFGETLKLTYCDPLGRIIHVTGEHADRLISVGKNIYADIPLHPDCPVPEYRRDA